MARRCSVFKRKGRPGWTVEHPDGRQQSGFRTRAEAEAERERLQAEALARRGLEADQPFGDYARRWLAQAAPHLRTGTVRHYTTALERHVLPRLGHIGVQELRRAHVRDLVAQLVGAGLSRKTAGNVRGVVHAVLAEAREDGLLVTNPAAGLGRTRAARLAGTKGERQSRVKALAAAQLAELLASADVVLRPEQALLLRVLALTGMRIGEATALQWADLDLDGRVALVRRGVTEGRVEGTKTGATRSVDLPQDLAMRLRAHGTRAHEQALAHGRARPEWIFAGATGAPRWQMYVRRDLARALRAAGLPEHFTPHSLRHTYASLMLSRGESLVYVQRQLGHATIQMTADLYGRWLPAGCVAVADRLEAAVTGRTGAVTAVSMSEECQTTTSVEAS